MARKDQPHSICENEDCSSLKGYGSMVLLLANLIISEA